MDLSQLCREYDTFKGKHMKLEMDLTKSIQKEQQISEVNIQNIETMKTEVEQFNLKLASFIDQLYDNEPSDS
ncbi:hypothetical protein [Bacillus mycoides]|nr:hypothetical protein [Bacillus cereus]